VVLYDADCGFCRWALAKLLAWDRSGLLRPVPIDSAEGERLLGELSEEQRQSSWHYVDRDGRRSSGGIAAVPLFRELPGGRPAAALLARFPGATERAYGWVSRHRGTLGSLIPGGARRRAETKIRRREAP
jgi:predicted DCC family thiol-disulfide oxidoreductase YuxK